MLMDEAKRLIATHESRHSQTLSSLNSYCKQVALKVHNGWTRNLLLSIKKIMWYTPGGTSASIDILEIICRWISWFKIIDVEINRYNSHWMRMTFPNVVIIPSSETVFITKKQAIVNMVQSCIVVVREHTGSEDRECGVYYVGQFYISLNINCTSIHYLLPVTTELRAITFKIKFTFG